MDLKLFSLILKRLKDTSIDDFECTIDGKCYGFKSIGNDKWNDEGKYQYRYEQGRLIEMDGNYKEIQQFNYAVTRCIQRSGSYFSDYYYDYLPYDFFEIEQIIIPEVIIPSHIDDKWNRIKIDLDEVVDEELELAIKNEIERVRIEQEIKSEQERLNKLYPMNKPSIIQKVNKNLKKKMLHYGIKEMRKEYFDIVVKEELESQDWIDYHKDKV